MSLHNSTVIENQRLFYVVDLIKGNFDPRSSEKERKGNALASGADEGRDKLR